MRNIGITKSMHRNVDNFTTNTGIKVRRRMNPILRGILKLATKRKVFIENFPILEKGTPYIFVSTHSFDEDVISALATINRSVYLLVGTTHQLEYNPQMYMAWLSGMIYVNRMDPQSRKDSVPKMLRILNSGSSILLFPEGGWNNTENLLVQPLFSGPYLLAKESGCKVVPIASFNEHGSKEIYIRVADPLDFTGLEKEDALNLLKDSFATMMYEMIEAHSTPLLRSDLEGKDSRLEFMEERRQEYLRVHWKQDVWEEELTFYHDKNYPSPQQVRATLSNVDITLSNAAIMSPFLKDIEIDKKYDFLQYMKKTWDK